MILIGGEPGIAKSTLLLQLPLKMKKILYVSGEESASQIKMRADRLTDIQNHIVFFIPKHLLKNIKGSQKSATRRYDCRFYTDTSISVD